MARCGCGGGSCQCNLEVGDGLSLTGSGSIANPWVVSLDDIDCAQVRPCISAGNGISYNPATGVITLRPSTDDGNTIEIGSDGGAYATVDCSLVRPCISAGDGASYDVTTGVVSARPSTDAGNNLIIGGDGGLFVPSGNATVNTGCGLTGDGSGGAPLTVGVSPWTYGCDLENEGGRVYCDADGILRTAPVARASFYQDVINTSYPGGVLVPSVTETTVESRPFNIPNDDPCRDAFVVLELELDVDLTLPVGARAMTGISGDDMTNFINSGTFTQTVFHVQTTKLFNRIIPAGGIASAPFVVSMGSGTNGAEYTRIQTAQRAFVFHLG